MTLVIVVLAVNPLPMSLANNEVPTNGEPATTLTVSGSATGVTPMVTEAVETRPEASVTS